MKYMRIRPQNSLVAFMLIVCMILLIQCTKQPIVSDAEPEYIIKYVYIMSEDEYSVFMEERLEPIVAPQPEAIAEVPVEPTLSAEDFDLICRLVATEARGECYEGQMAVAQVVKDRMESDNSWYGGPTASGVIYKKGQFAKPWTGNLNSYPSISKAVTAVFENGERPLDGKALYFYNPKTASRAGVKSMSSYRSLGDIGAHRFRGE